MPKEGIYTYEECLADPSLRESVLVRKLTESLADPAFQVGKARILHRHLSHVSTYIKAEYNRGSVRYRDIFVRNSPNSPFFTIPEDPNQYFYGEQEYLGIDKHEQVAPQPEHNQAMNIELTIIG